MLGSYGNLPPLPSPQEMMDYMRLLAVQAGDAVHKQHLVSGVLLSEFSEPIGQKGAPQVYSLNLEWPDSKIRGRGLEECGLAPVEDFVKYASRSLENQWWEIENRLHDTMEAVKSGSALDNEEHRQILQDLAAVHFARSFESHVIHWRTWHATYESNQQWWLSRPDLLDRLVYMRPGLYVAGQTGREIVAKEMQQDLVDWAEAGAFLRANVEMRYSRMRAWFRSLNLQIITPTQGEFIIGDVPALTAMDKVPNAGVINRISAGSAREIVLPLSPKFLLRVVDTDRPSQYEEASRELVDQFNLWQVTGAFAHVYIRPGSGLESFVRSVARPRPSKGPYANEYKVFVVEKKRSS